MRQIFTKILITGFVSLVLLITPVFHTQAAPDESQKCPDDGSTAFLQFDKICNPEPSFYFSFSNHNQNTFAGLLTFIIQGLLGIVGLLSILFIIIGGYKYVTSAGNEEAAESGKKTLVNAIIGLVIVILSYVIVAVVINALQGNT